MRKIAVVSRHRDDTINWLNQRFKIHEVDTVNHIVITRDEIEFHIICEEPELRNKYFDDYMVAPDYYSLIDLVKLRIR